MATIFRSGLFRPLVLLSIFGIATLAIALSMHFGPLGFMPLDQGIVFEGAWRVLNGEVPYRDFFMPNALVPILQQLLFFKVFDVSMNSFFLNAAISNAVFCVFSFMIFHKWLGNWLWATGLGLISAFYFYPPIGYPYMDSHAWGFVIAISLLMILFFYGGLSFRLEKLLVASLFPLAFLAFFSKQIPSGFLVLQGIVFVAYLVLNRRVHLWVFAKILAFSLIFCVVFIALSLLLFNIPPSLLFDILIRHPLMIGEQRQAAVNWWGIIFSDDFNQNPKLKLLTYFPWITFGAFLLAIFLKRTRVALWALTISAILFFETKLFVSFTCNQSHYALCSYALIMGALIFYFKNFFVNRPWLYLVATLLVFYIAGRDLKYFYRDALKTRVANDMTFNDSHVNPNAFTNKVFKGISWHLPLAYYSTPKDIEELIAELGDKNFILISDTTALNAATGNENPLPYLWFHPGLSVPVEGSLAAKHFEAVLQKNLERLKPTLLVFEGNETLMGIKIESFPFLRERFKSLKLTKTIGPFKIFEL